MDSWVEGRVMSGFGALFFVCVLPYFQLLGQVPVTDS